MILKKKETINLKKIICISIITLLSSFVFILEFKKPTGIFIENNNHFYKFLLYFYSSMKPFEIIWVFLVIFIFYFDYQILFNEKTTKRKRIFSTFMAIILTIITLIGKSLVINNTLDSLYSSSYQIFKMIIIALGYFFLYYTICISFLNIKLLDIKKKAKGKIETFFDKHTFIISLVFILLAWLPTIIVYYPGVSSGDTVDSLAQFFNIKDLCWSAKAMNLLNDKIIINKHHSVLFTLLLGSIVKVGKFFSSYTVGIFLFVILQVLLLSIVFSLFINYIKKINIPFYLCVCFLLFIGLCPIIYFYAITVVKDTIGAILILCYNVLLLQIIRNYDNVIKNRGVIIIFMLVILLILMIKNNSLFIIISSYISCLLIFRKNKNKWKKLLYIGLVPLIIFLSYDKILLPTLDITGTDKKETFSIPFMQIARLANRNSDAISNNDKEIINKVLNYDKIKNDYRPNLADPVKNTYKKEATKEELQDFWKVYFKYLKKYPKLYLAAFVNSTYAYLFPEAGETSGLLKIDYRMGTKSIFKVDNLLKFSDARDIINCLQKILEKFPFFGLFSHVAFYDWFLLLSLVYILKSKQYKYTVPLISLLAIFLSCLISPVNGSFRYILPIVFCFPLILSIDYLVYINNKNIK